MNNEPNTVPAQPSSEDQNASDSGISTAFGQEKNTYAFPSPMGISGMGVCSIICALCSFFCVVPSVLGIVLALFGIRRNRRDILCYIGLGLSAAFLAYGIVLIIQAWNSPEFQSLYGAVSSGSDL